MRHDTQIYKTGEATEWEKHIIDTCNPDVYKRVNDDNANGYYAVSLPIDQNETDIGEILVDLLNALAEYRKEKPQWYLGDPEEEYVFID